MYEALASLDYYMCSIARKEDISIHEALASLDSNTIQHLSYKAK